MHTPAELLKMGELLEEKGDYKASAHLYRRGLRLQEQTHGPEDLELAPFLYNLGLVSYALDDLKGAEHCLTRLLGLLVQQEAQVKEQIVEIEDLLHSVHQEMHAAIPHLVASA